MSTGDSQQPQNGRDSNPSARLLTELEELSRSHFLAGRRHQSGQGAPISVGRPDVTIDHQVRGRHLIPDPTIQSYFNIPGQDIVAPHQQSSNSFIPTSVNRPTDNVHQSEHVQVMHGDNSADDERSNASSVDHTVDTPSQIADRSYGTPISAKQEMGSPHQPSPSPKAVQSPSANPPNPSDLKVGRTEIDRLMLAVQASGHQDEHLSDGVSRAPSTKSEDSVPSTPKMAGGDSPQMAVVVGSGGAIIPGQVPPLTSMNTGSSGDSDTLDGVSTATPQIATSSSSSSSSASSFPPANVIKHGEYNFACTFPGCTKRFKQRAHLHTHLRSHTGERPFICPYENCRKLFSQRCNLHTHIRSHTGERPYKCEVCGKAFSQQGNMRHHVLIHYNEHPLECRIDNCGKTFNQLGNLKAHQNAAHRGMLQAFTQKLQSGLRVEDLPDEEKDMFEYFCGLYKNSNRGIKGRGKGTKTIVLKPSASDQQLQMQQFQQNQQQQQQQHLNQQDQQRNQLQQHQMQYPPMQQMQPVHHQHQQIQMPQQLQQQQPIQQNQHQQQHQQTHRQNHQQFLYSTYIPQDTYLPQGASYGYSNSQTYAQPMAQPLSQPMAQPVAQPMVQQFDSDVQIQQQMQPQQYQYQMQHIQPGMPYQMYYPQGSVPMAEQPSDSIPGIVYMPKDGQ